MHLKKQLALAIEIAARAHHDQFDRGGNAYILHPLHLMNQLLFDTQLATIAVLHDVIEDSDVSIQYLQNCGISDRVCTALVLLTHAEEHTYEQYIECVCTNHDAIRVKRKDLEHNSDITRLKGITDKDLQRIEKYHKAFIKLGEARSNFQE